MLLPLLFYSVAFVVGAVMLRRHLSLIVFFVMLLSWVGHFIGTYVAARIPDSDARTTYFPHATRIFHGLNTGLMENLFWLVRHFLTGDSFLATFYFFGAIAFLGSIAWYLFYLHCIQKLNIKNAPLLWPALIMMCWPSFFVMSVGMGKDALSYLFIPLVFLMFFKLHEKQFSVYCVQAVRFRVTRTINALLFLFFTAALLCVRPYLAILFSGSFLLYHSVKCFLKQKGFQYHDILQLILCVFLVMASIYWALGANFFEHIHAWIVYIVDKQAGQVQGTHFNIPVHHTASAESTMLSRLMWLPYAFIMNLCGPLFFGVHNIQGFLASLENMVLIMMMLWMIYYRRYIAALFKLYHPLILLFLFFIVGIAFLALWNSNMGLSMRHRVMYLPGLLLIYALTYAAKKSGFLKGRL